MVFGGQFCTVSNLSITIEQDRTPVFDNLGRNVGSVSKSRQVTVNITIPQQLYNVSNPDTVESVRLYNSKHELVFRNPYTSTVEQSTDGMHIELCAEDYTVSTEWIKRYTS